MQPAIWFTARCDCGWSYGPGIQTDVHGAAKRHRPTCPGRPLVDLDLT